jgi:hypothetical protein
MIARLKYAMAFAVMASCPRLIEHLGIKRSPRQVVEIDFALDTKQEAQSVAASFLAAKENCALHNQSR